MSLGHEHLLATERYRDMLEAAETARVHAALRAMKPARRGRRRRTSASADHSVAALHHGAAFL